MTQADTTSAQETGAPGWVRVLLVIITAIETLTGVSELTVLFGDISEIPGYSLGGLAIIAKLALHPVVALVALVFAVKDDVPRSIIALAAWVMLGWLTEVPSFFIHGIGFSLQYGDLYVLAIAFVFPVLGVAAIWLALQKRQLGLAAIFVSVPTIAQWLGVLAFLIAVMTYGF